MGGVRSTHGELGNTYKILIGRPEEKRSLGRAKRRWEDHIKMDLKEKGLEGVDWIHLAKDRKRWWAFIVMVMNLRVP
jgi:hypothetical protein